MWKIVVVLLLTALAILLARLAYDAPVIHTRVGAPLPRCWAACQRRLRRPGVRG